MSQRRALVLYVVLLHLVLAAVLFMDLELKGLWFVGAELVLVLSVALGVHLLRSLFKPLELIRTGSELIREADFSVRFREIGQREMDELLRTYNQMIDRLREERLRLEEKSLLLSKILEVSPSGLVILDHEGNISELNPAARRLLVADSDEAPTGEPVAAVGELGAGLAEVPGDGSKVVTLADGRRLRIVHGSFLDRGFTRSFFLLEELTEELRASERTAYGRVIRVMAHEVGNSVGAVASLLDSLQSRVEETDPARHAMEVAVTRLHNLDRFMRDFAQVVRLPAPTLHSSDLRALVRGVGDLFRGELERRRIEWQYAEPSEPVYLALDAAQIEQVLVNLVQNAVEAIGREGRIRVAVVCLEGGVELSLHDSGPGLSEDASELLFTPFWSSKEDGLGVGLTLAREILTNHRVGFGLTNHPEGGAVFRIRF